MSDEFNLSSLQSRINEIKEEGEESTGFTLRFIECLMYRHSLKECLLEDTEFDFVSDHIMEKLKSGIIPTEEELIILSPDEQNQLLFELIWFCGMGALASYGADEDNILYGEDEERNGDEEESNVTTFDVILDMRNQSIGHYSATYIIAALSLLMSQIPSRLLVESITNNYNDSEDQIQSNMNIFIELSSAILDRYREDMAYYDRDVPPEELSQAVASEQ